MATYYSNVWNTIIRPTHAGGGGVVEVPGSLKVPNGTALATADVLKLFRVGSGGHVRNVWVENSDFATTAGPGTFGHYGVDDGVAIDADSIIADVALETATSRNFENFASDLTSAGANFQAPFATLTEDASFEIVVGTMNGGISNTDRYIRFVVEVVFFGADRNPFAYDWNGEASGLSNRE